MEARETYARIQAARRLLTLTLDVASVLLLLGALWPAHRVQLYALAVPFWILILPAAIVFAVRESIWLRRCQRPWTT
jgi:hypothetical protein